MNDSSRTPEVDDLTDRLARLHDHAVPTPDGAAVARDLADATSARHARNARRARLGGLAAVAVTALTLGGVAVAGHGGDAPSRSAGPAPTTSSLPRPSTPSSDAARHHQAPAHTGPLRLVAYHGDQQPGFTVAQVPEGYVLQGSTPGIFAVAEKGDTSPVYSFVGKLIVTAQPASEVHRMPGDPVTVNGDPGAIYRHGDGVVSLDYRHGDVVVNVQKWSNIDLTDDQLEQFAAGITVSPDVSLSHG